MGADALRSYDEATGLFTGVGGASVTVGVMDTGLNVDHPDISSNRRSICVANFTNASDEREEDQDTWLDYRNHGTHVTGIVLGNGAMDPSRAGMAPLVQDIRFAKAINSYGDTSALAWSRAMDWFGKPTACGDGVPRKALVINSSPGGFADLWEGRSVVERKIDASVWAARQLFVAAAGNGADQTLSSMVAAKNTLSVGAAQNIGDIAGFSSHGPTVDGRLMPKIVGTGVSVAAAEGSGAPNGGPGCVLRKRRRLRPLHLPLPDRQRRMGHRSQPARGRLPSQGAAEPDLRPGAPCGTRLGGRPRRLHSNAWRRRRHPQHRGRAGGVVRRHLDDVQQLVRSGWSERAHRLPGRAGLGGGV